MKPIFRRPESGLRSPIKDKVLRLPGQSSEKALSELFDDKLLPYVLVGTLMPALAVLEWARTWLDFVPSPIVISGCALIIFLFCAWKILRLLPVARSLRQGIQGEVAVGQFLERLREAGYHVFHDVMGPTFNVDHVLVGPAGVFTVETKTWSKPSKGAPRVTLDAQGLLVGNLRPDRDPIIQARAQANWLYQQIKDSTGKSFSVKPVIVFPGWFIDPSAQRLSNLWILEPKALPTYLHNEATCLEATEVKLVAYHLSRMIRASA